MKTTRNTGTLSARIAAITTADRAMDAFLARVTTPGR